MNDTAIENGDGYTINGNLSATWHYSCSGVMYFGGADISAKGSKITKTFTGLPTHTSVMINFTFIYGDYWVTGDYAYLYADDVKVWENMGYKYEQNYTTDCGKWEIGYNPGWYNLTESIVDHSVYVFHSGSSITLSWNASLYWDSLYAWFALRNVQITLPCNNANCSTCHPNDITKCVTCKPNYYLLGNTCYSPCPLRYFASGTVCACRPCFFWFIILMTFFFSVCK